MNRMETINISEEMIRNAASRKFQETLGRPPTAAELIELVLLINKLHGILIEEEIAVKDGKVVIAKKNARGWLESISDL